MTWEAGTQQLESAHEARQSGDLLTAGNEFTLAGFEYFGDSSMVPHGNASKGLYCFLLATTCYRIKGSEKWAGYRAEQGSNIAKEFADRSESGPTADHEYDQARNGAWYEYNGDLLTIAGLNGADDAYEAAREIYVAAGDPDTSYYEQEHGWLLTYFGHLLHGLDRDSEQWEDFHYKPGNTLTDWLEYKRGRLSSLLDQLEDREDWTWRDED